MFEPLPKHIVVFHSEVQAIYGEFPAGTKFIKGWNVEEIETLPNDTLVVIDDLMSEVKDCKIMSRLFTKMSHHRNLSVAWLTQNLYPAGKECRTISLNAHYLILFPNPRDGRQIVNLANQMFPFKKKAEHFLNEFKSATMHSFNPIMIILRPDHPETDRIMKNILSSQPQYVDL